jgi:hypothetical protein
MREFKLLSTRWGLLTPEYFVTSRRKIYIYNEPIL